MLCTITIPGKDYTAIKRYLKRGYPNTDVMELLGRIYEANVEEYIITAEILRNQAAILYTISRKDATVRKTVKAPICHFYDSNVTVVFSVDRSYE